MENPIYISEHEGVINKLVNETIQEIRLALKQWRQNLKKMLNLDAIYSTLLLLFSHTTNCLVVGRIMVKKLQNS